MPEITTIGWTILCLAGLMIGLSKTGLPGIGILSVLVVTMVIPAKTATGLILPMLLAGDVFAVAYWRRHASWSHLVKLIPFAMIGIVIGWRLLYIVNNKQLEPIIGLIVLAMLILNFWRMRRAGDDLQVPKGLWFPIVIGIAAGVTTMMANAAGAIMIIYLVAMRLPKEQFIGTAAWYFLLLNAFKIPFSANTPGDNGVNLITLDTLKLNLFMVPVIAVGAFFGVRLAKKIPEKAFNIIVQVLAIAGSVYLLRGVPGQVMAMVWSSH